MSTTRFLWFIVMAVALQSNAVGAAPLLLNCEIVEGAPKGSSSTRRIMIDEEKGVVIDHYHPSRPDGMLRTPDGRIIDGSMKITIKNDKLVMANDSTGAFLITKHDGQFVISFVSPVPLNDGSFLAIGNTLWGKCVRSPFD